MKTLKGMALSMLGLVAAIAAVGCGDAIQGCQTTVQRCLVGCSYPLGFSQRLLSCVRCLSAPKRTNAASVIAGKSSVLPTTPTNGGVHDEMPDVWQ